MAFSYGLRIGKYEIRNKLGHGGYGIVYAARDTELGRDLAMKFLRPDYLTRPQVVQRFLQEARSAAKIVHPGIVTVYECGHVEGTATIADGTVYIAMELLTGEDLSDKLQAGQMPLEIATEFAIQLAAALEAAHKSGIVHRDLKPDNIYLVPDASVEGGQRVKILDFGIAKLADDHRPTTRDEGATGVHTHSMMMLGTPRYMSPEQCRSSSRVDHRSDIYTLGCLLFEMICGKSPYDGDAGELIAKHQLAPVPRMRQLRPETPAYIDVLVSAMLAKDPSDRPPTMERVRLALAAANRPDELEPIDTTMSASAAEQTVVDIEPVHRRRLWLAAAGGAVLVLLGIGVGSLLFRRDAPPEGPPAPIEAALSPPAAAPDGAVYDRIAKELECRDLASEHRWDDLLVCADALARNVPNGDPVVRELTTTSVIEARNDTVYGRFEEAVKKRDLAEAFRWLDRIDDESVYKEAANEELDKLVGAMPASTDPRGPRCNADKLADRAQNFITNGSYTQALALIEASLRCRPDASLHRLALLAACHAGNSTKAKRYYAKLPTAQQPPMMALCVRNKIALP